MFPYRKLVLTYIIKVCTVKLSFVNAVYIINSMLKRTSENNIYPNWSFILSKRKNKYQIETFFM